MSDETHLTDAERAEVEKFQAELRAKVERDRIMAIPRPLPAVWARDVVVDLNAEHLVEDLIFPGSFVLTYGESNTGKTFLVFDMAVAISQGRPWFNRQTKKGFVLYIAGEGYNGVALRKMAYEQRGLIEPGASLAIVQRAVDFLMSESDVLGLITLVKQLEYECGEKCVAIIVDTLARAIPGGSDAEAADMGKFIANADLVRAQTHAALIAIHHAGKDLSKGARGHSSLRAAVDTEILVEGQADPRSVTCTKQRDLERCEPFTFELELQVIGHNARGKAITSCVVKASDLAAQTRRKRLSPKQSLALRVLRETLESEGETPSRDITNRTKGTCPAVVLCTQIWREKLRQADIFPGSLDSSRKAFTRVKEDLLNQGLIDIWEDYVWLTPDSRT